MGVSLRMEKAERSITCSTPSSSTIHSLRLRSVGYRKIEGGIRGKEGAPIGVSEVIFSHKHRSVTIGKEFLTSVHQSPHFAPQLG
jgi:hypothetical protein